jgi:hypothetical protein
MSKTPPAPAICPEFLAATGGIDEQANRIVSIALRMKPGSYETTNLVFSKAVAERILEEITAALSAPGMKDLPEDLPES